MTKTKLIDTLHNRRALVFDPLLFKDDRTTPLSFTRRPATIICHYGYRYTSNWNGEIINWKYPDCVDVIFDHRPDKISKGHFTDRIELI